MDGCGFVFALSSFSVLERKVLEGFGLERILVYGLVYFSHGAGDSRILAIRK